MSPFAQTLRSLGLRSLRCRPALSPSGAQVKSSRLHPDVALQDRAPCLYAAMADRKPLGDNVQTSDSQQQQQPTAMPGDSQQQQHTTTV